MKTPHETTPRITRIAVPYYGEMVRPGKGLEKVYFLIDIDADNDVSENRGMHIWNTREHPEFSHWLCCHGVQGIVCEDCRPTCETALRKHGIWVRSGKPVTFEQFSSNCTKAA